MFDGLEVDMLSLGDADSILVTRWDGNKASRVLIDGGNKGDASIVRSFLRGLNITHLNAVVCTHPHDDHAAGLIELVRDESLTIGTAYTHYPQLHLEMSKVGKALEATKGLEENSVLEKSLNTAHDLVTALLARSIPIYEPFTGTKIEFLTVVGPSQAYYEELLGEFQDADRIRAISEKERLWNIQNSLIQKGLLSSSDLPPENSARGNWSSLVM